MNVKMISGGKTVAVNDSYAIRLISQGKAVALPVAVPVGERKSKGDAEKPRSNVEKPGAAN